MKASLKQCEVSAFIFEEENDAFKAWCAENNITAEWSGLANGGMFLTPPNKRSVEIFGPGWGGRKYFVYNGDVEIFSEDEFKEKYIWL